MTINLEFILLPIWSIKVLTKYKLPRFSELKQIQVDSKKLLDFYESAKNQFSDVMTSNQALCGIHHQLTEKVYENFEQISLTKISEDLKDQATAAMNHSCENIESEITGVDSVSKSQRIRTRKALATSNSLLNEHNYSVPTELMKSSYVQDIVSQFKGRVTRVRLVRLKSNSTVPPHIDYDPTYAVRVIIPIIADEKCVNMFWSKNEMVSTCFKPGRAYFLNTGIRHAVVNFSEIDRVTLMLSIDGQQDVIHLEREGHS